MEDIRRWTRTVIPGGATVFICLLCLRLLFPELLPASGEAMDPSKWGIEWAGLGLVLATLTGYMQSQVYFGVGWERMTLEYEMFPELEVPDSERTRSRCWAEVSHRWQAHADCVPGFNSINSRMEALGDALHALGGVLMGSAMVAATLLPLAFCPAYKSKNGDQLAATLVLVLWLLVFGRGYAALKKRFKAYVCENWRYLLAHALKCERVLRGAK